MASQFVPIEEFDNDDFDWEAAVREIDSACQGACTSNHQDLAISTTAVTHAAAEACRKTVKTDSKCRQSTLDRFVDSFAKRRKADEDFLRSKIQEKNATPDPGRSGDLGGGDEPAGVEIDLETAKTWIYPVNVPLRDYQLSVAKSAPFSNTLVALPTGLGKTLITAVVMHNCFRWFPDDKMKGDDLLATYRGLNMKHEQPCDGRHKSSKWQASFSPRFGTNSAEKNGTTCRCSLSSSMNRKQTSKAPSAQKLTKVIGKGAIRNDGSLTSSGDGCSTMFMLYPSGEGEDQWDASSSNGKTLWFICRF